VVLYCNLHCYSPLKKLYNSVLSQHEELEAWATESCSNLWNSVALVSCNGSYIALLFGKKQDHVKSEKLSFSVTLLFPLAI